MGDSTKFSGADLRVERGDGWECRLGRWEDSPPGVVDNILSDPPFTDHVSRNANQRTGLYERGKLEIRPTKSGGLSFEGSSPKDIVKTAQLSRRWSVYKCAIEQVGRYETADPELNLPVSYSHLTGPTTSLV